MALDIVLVKAKLDELAVESDEAAAAKVALDNASVAATEAQAAVATAVDSFAKEQEDKVLKLREIIALLNAELPAV